MTLDLYGYALKFKPGSPRRLNEYGRTHFNSIACAGQMRGDIDHKKKGAWRGSGSILLPS